MAIFKLLRGKRQNLPINKIDGYAYFCADDASFHIDYLDENGDVQRQQLNAKDSETLNGASLSAEIVESDDVIPTSKAVYDLAETKADKTEIDTLNSVNYTLIAFDVTQIVFDTSSGGDSGSSDSSDTTSPTNAVLGYAVLGQMVLG